MKAGKRIRRHRGRQHSDDTRRQRIGERIEYSGKQTDIAVTKNFHVIRKDEFFGYGRLSENVVPRLEAEQQRIHEGHQNGERRDDQQKVFEKPHREYARQISVPISGYTFCGIQYFTHREPRRDEGDYRPDKNPRSIHRIPPRISITGN